MEAWSKQICSKDEKLTVFFPRPPPPPKKKKKIWDYQELSF